YLKMSYRVKYDVAKRWQRRGMWRQCHSWGMAPPPGHRRAAYRRLNRTGTFSVILALAMAGGGAGTGEARRTISTAAWSSAPLPDERERDADSTRPDESMVKRTEAVPCADSPAGNRLKRLRWALTRDCQRAGETPFDAPPSVGRGAAALGA